MCLKFLMFCFFFFVKYEIAVLCTPPPSPIMSGPPPGIFLEFRQLKIIFNSILSIYRVAHKLVMSYDYL